ncbi:MarR family transcriptional regulator [Mycobacterium sp. CVI_P3]|uniref:MarR family transcriptional regulator n=1 Tax=Mycobacterium pinniadriaticum TaxID=2994102 RepID=A0ABT3SJE8_9MYCO|nr:MarR family transcriptional regulator [Mycobacterium pinniadriaticum]MCX2933204.1 MarR family transcriptional regulator [Mycobacterium pinniadriaticum]MCX2939626.1 MarR family transcriptional regulator [Mycobacterium pinniadriaticum]
MSTRRPGDVGRQSARERRKKLGFDDVEASAWMQFESVAMLLHDVVDRALARDHRLSLAEVQMLVHLKNHGPSPMGTLAQTLMMTPGALTQQTQRLERRGLVYRCASRDDGRRVIAVITEDGNGLLAAALETYARLVRAHFLNELTRPQMIALGDSCRRIIARLKAVESPLGLPDR